MLKTIIAVERHSVTQSILVLNFDVPGNDFDLEAAVKAASTEYCQTEEGRRIYKKNCGYFNWEDFNTHVPDSICQKHGFRKLPTDSPVRFVGLAEPLVFSTDAFLSIT